MNKFLEGCLEKSYKQASHEEHSWGISETRRVQRNKKILEAALPMIRNRISELCDFDMDGVDIRLPPETDEINEDNIPCVLLVPQCTPIRFRVAIVINLYAAFPDHEYWYGVCSKTSNSYIYTFSENERTLRMAVYKAHEEWSK